MSIRRQYSLPNCTLILDGIGDGQRANEVRPLMSTLVSAECHISGQKKPLTGGLEFFQQLITAVSNYTQELLSKVANAPIAQQVGNVRLEKGQEHRLIAQSEQGEVDWQLSTVQLFDLTEAIDQFLADGSTLPTLLVGIQPAPRAAKNAGLTQAAPIGLGLSGLAATALAMYLVPAPTKITLPEPTAKTAPVSKTSDKPPNPATKSAGAQQTVPVTNPVASPSTNPVSTPSASAAASPSSTESKKPVERSAVDPKVNDNPTQVAFLERKLRREINQKWEDRKGIADKLSFTVTADEEGKIVKYVPKSPTAESKKDQIPLAEMVPADTAKAEADAAPVKKTADFSVSFTPNGAIEIKRDKLLPGDITDGKPLADTDRVKSLAKDLEEKVKLTATPTFKKELTYRVAADENGEIVDYDPLNGAAFDHEKETPLPAVTKYDAEAASGTKPLAQYTLVYRPDGKIEIKPRN